MFRGDSCIRDLQSTGVCSEMIRGNIYFWSRSRECCPTSRGDSLRILAQVESRWHK